MYQGLMVGETAMLEGEPTGQSCCEEFLRTSGTNSGCEDAIVVLPDLPRYLYVRD